MMFNAPRISFLLAFAVAGMSPSFASGQPEGDGTTGTVNAEICIHFPGSRHEQDRITNPDRCEPLPVALDLRFLDDDYSSETYELPVTLDLDWESGEP